MLFATDKFILSFGDTAKLTIQYENTTITNTGKKQAIVEASNDGYAWTRIASIAPKSSLPLKIEALYVRLTTDTTISVVNTNPIPRDAKKSDIAVNIDTKALVTQDDLQAYVTKNELNDLVHHPDLSGFVTKSQVQQMIPKIPTPPDITGLASKESVEAKADKSAVEKLENLVTTKADKSTVDRIQNDLANQITPSIAHLHENKADKTELSALAKKVTQSEATVGTLATQVTGFQSALANRVTKEQAEDANRVLLNAIAARPTTEQLNALHDEVKQKANQQQVAAIADIYKGKAESVHTHRMSDIDGLQKLLDTKANTNHNHTMSDVTGLDAALSSKAATEHSHTWGSITGKPTTFAPSSHTHAWTQITGVPTSNTLVAGIVQLNDTLTSTATDQALTAKQGKVLNDSKPDKTDFANSKTEIGYQKLPNELIIQWGENAPIVSNPSGLRISIAFPIAFPNACLQVFTTRHVARHTTRGEGGALVISKSTTDAEISLPAFNGSLADVRGFSWLAIGY